MNKWVTFSDLEQKYNISRQALEQRIRKRFYNKKTKQNPFKNKYMKKNKHRWYINQIGVKILNPKIKHDSKSPLFRTRAGSVNNGATRVNLMKDNRILMQTIKSQQDTINKLSNQVHSKKLLKSINATNQRLLANQCKQKKLPNTKQHRFWWKLFH